MVRVLALATMQWETLVQLGKKKCTINVVIAIFFFQLYFSEEKACIFKPATVFPNNTFNISKVTTMELLFTVRTRP